MQDDDALREQGGGERARGDDARPRDGLRVACRGERVAQEAGSVLGSRSSAIDDQHADGVHDLEGEVLPVVAGYAVAHDVPRRSLPGGRVRLDDYADAVDARRREAMREGQRDLARRGKNSLRRGGQVADVLAVDLEPESVRRLVGRLSAHEQVEAEGHLALDRHDGPARRDRAERDVGDCRGSAGGQVDHPEMRRAGPTQAEFASQKLPAEHRFRVGPIRLLIVGQDDDLAIRLVALRQDRMCPPNGIGPVASARRRRRHDQRRNPVAHDEDRDFVADRPAIPVIAYPGDGAFHRGRAVVAGNGHAGAGVHQNDAIARCLAARRRVEERPREAGDEDGEQGDTEEHEQDFFQKQSAAGRRTHLQELHRPPVDRVVPPPVEQVDERRDGQHAEAGEHPRGEQERVEEREQR